MKTTRIALFLLSISALAGTLVFGPDASAADRYIKDLRSAQDFSINFSRIKQTRGGGYVMVGITDQRSKRDANGNVIEPVWNILVVKVNAHWHQQWAKVYGGDKYEIGYDITQTTDG